MIEYIYMFLTIGENNKMEIKLISSNLIILNEIKNNKIKNFNLSFDISEEFVDKLNETEILIKYNISLFENKTNKFGKLNALYSFQIPESIHIITLNEETKKMMVLACLKSNHKNIFSLIKESLQIKGLKIIESNREILH